MTTLRHRMDAELASALDAVPRGPAGVFDIRDIPTARAQLRAFAEMAASAAPDDRSVAVETVEARRLDGDVVPIRLFRPAATSTSLPALLWFHGGGQVMGYAAQEDFYLKRLVCEVGCAVASVDYRLAPEAPAPAAAEDGHAAYRWLGENARALGLAADRIGLAGASGGGCVAAATALLLRDRGAPPPRLLSLNYPMLDDRNETASSHEITDIGIWDRATNMLAWKMILGDRAGGADVSPYAAPARADDLRGLPPTFLAVAELDVFRDEDLAFAAALERSSVAVDLHVYRGAYHGWDGFAPNAAVSRAFFQAWFGFLTRHFAA